MKDEGLRSGEGVTGPGEERRRVCMRCRRKVVEACGRREAGERGVSGEVEVGGMNKCGRSGNDRNTEC